MQSDNPKCDASELDYTDPKAADVSEEAEAKSVRERKALREVFGAFVDAKIAAEAGRHEEAVEKWTRAIDGLPIAAGWRCQRGESYLQLGR